MTNTKTACRHQGDNAKRESERAILHNSLCWKLPSSLRVVEKLQRMNLSDHRQKKMNEHSPISSVLITKNEDTNKYETRFLAQRDNIQDKLSTGKCKKRSSRIVDQMGGRFRLETLVMYLTQRVSDDPLLSPIFGALSVDELVLLLAETMWYALDDSFETKKHYKSKILRKL